MAEQLDIEMTVLKQPWDGTGGELYRTGSTIVRTIRLVDPMRSLERISIARRTLSLSLFTQLIPYNQSRPGDRSYQPNRVGGPGKIPRLRVVGVVGISIKICYRTGSCIALAVRSFDLA